MNRLKGALRDKKKQDEKNAPGKDKKKVRPRIFGDFRWDFLRTCRHDLKNKPSQCPLCTLAQSFTSTFLTEEKVAREHSRVDSMVRRAEMRYELVKGWSLNHGCAFTTKDTGPVIDIVFSGMIALAAVRCSETCGLDFGLLKRLLALRARIVEIGNYAATFIQCRVRKFLLRRRVRRFMVTRFTWDPATRMRPHDTYVDTQTGKRYQQKPILLRNERPASPRAIQRRLNSEAKKTQEKDFKYKAAMAKIKKDGQLNIYGIYEKQLTDLRQLTIMEDTIEVAIDMHLEKVEKSKPKEYDSDEDEDVISMRKAKEDAERVKLLAAQAEAKSKLRVFPTFSPPFPAMRELAVSLALTTEPLPPPTPAPVVVASTTKEEKKKKQKRVPKVTLNDRLKVLEQRRWEALKCANGKDVLKILLCDENNPMLSSALHIASDEFKFWHGDILEPGPHPWDAESDEEEEKEKEKKVKAADEKKQSPQTINPDDEESLLESEALKCDVLPIFMKLRKFPAANRGPNGHFRMFFLDGEFVGATQASPWCFYEEILFYRDEILAQMRIFSESDELVAMLSKAMEERETRLRRTRRPLGKDLYNQSKRDPVSLYAPSASEIYGAKSSRFAPPQEITKEDILKIADKYKFAMKLSDFKKKFRDAQKARNIKANAKKSKKKGDVQLDFDDFDFDSSAIKSIDISGGKAVIPKYKGTLHPLEIPDADTLPGTAVFEQTFVNVPGGKDDMLQLRQKCFRGLRRVVKSLDPEIKEEKEWAYTPLGPDDDWDDVPEQDRILPKVVYHVALSQLASATDTSMIHRILRKNLDQLIADLGDELPMPPIYDLVAIDVTIDIPSPNAITTGRKTGVDALDKEYKLSLQVLDVAGIYSSQKMEPHPSLDIGLLDWGLFYRRPEEAFAALSERRKASDIADGNAGGLHPVLSNNPLGVDKSMESSYGLGGGGMGAPRPVIEQSSAPRVRVNDKWSNPIPTPDSKDTTSGIDALDMNLAGSGISIYSSRLPSGKNFEFRILAEPISKTYASNSIPPKVMNWLNPEPKSEEPK